MNRIRTFTWLFLILFFIITVFSNQFHHIRGKMEVPGQLQKELADLAARSLERSDVPVGAVLLYEGEVIGRGFNTVFRDRDPSGHAEINALRDAMKKLGIKSLMTLNRQELILYSTYEPCEMCMGTLQHYNISKVVYLKEKPVLMTWKQQMKGFYNKIRKRQGEGGNLQDSLFLLHPGYPER